ncbi:hypothetical protein EUX98_g2386 [Antrodiella citrinella]|uniref:Caffeoyl-CoA O-methyltransferase n=1 Tax=Antrodiella citrinella TaxID=2447956 RepID=A0A4S4MZ30_9APHY|nr:hypothetical protein EUX98_g2386 [Antrodiella citrinella]
MAHTPHDRISHLLSHAYDDLDSFSRASSDSNALDLSKILEWLDEARQVIDGYDDYVAEHSSPHPTIVDEMLAQGDQRDWDKVFREGRIKHKLIPEMSAGGYEAVVLQQLAKISKAKTILEIGMFTGTTTVSLALLPTVDKVVTLDIEPYLREINTPYFQQAGVAHKIDIRIDDALSSLTNLHKEGASFDMIFIDAHKPSYIKYFDSIMASPHLLAKGGLIAVDNTVFAGGPWVPNPPVSLAKDIHKFNEYVKNYPDVEVVMLPIEDGISLIRRKDE